MQRNIKLFSIYTAFSYDILFFYAISILFLVSVKDLNFNQIALSSSIYGLASILFQLPASIFTDKIGLKNSMILGNISCLIGLICYILANSFTIIIVGDLFLSFGFALKGVSESPFIYTVLKNTNETSIFAKIQGRGTMLYFLFEAIACIISGFLYVINPYLPLTFSMIACIIATIIAYSFIDIKTHSDKDSFDSYFSNLISGFKFIFKSKRLHALLIFSCIFYGITALSILYMKILLNDLDVSSNSFGYIFAIIAISSAIGSAIQDRIERHNRNRTLSVLSVTYVLSFLAIGVFSLTKIPVNAIVILGVIVFIVQAVIRGAYRVIIKQYISRYTTNTIRTRIMSVYYLSENLGASVILYISSLFLDRFDLGLIYVVSGAMLFIFILLVLNYMNSRVGLNPDEYSKRDRLDLDEDQ